MFAPSGGNRGLRVPNVPEPAMGWAGAWLFLGLLGAGALRRNVV